MKSDTAIFASLPISKHFNFAPETARGDPFLIQTSVSSNIVGGKGARALRKGKEGQDIKRVLPLAADDMSKAKACEEMILYERPFSPQAPPSTSPKNPERAKTVLATTFEFPAPSATVITEFVSALTNYIRDTHLP